MRKILLLILSVALLLSGCSWLDGEYHSVKPHASDSTKLSDDAVTVSGYMELRDALVKMVTTGREQSTFYITGFELEDAAAAAKRCVESLKQQGAEFIVCLSHAGTGESLETSEDEELAKAAEAMNAADVLGEYGISDDGCGLASAVFARKPGDGSAREQAASCQKVLGGFANICYEFATKRYRSNCINWGILPFTLDKDTPFEYEVGDCVFVPAVREAVLSCTERIPAKVIRADGRVEDMTLNLAGLTPDEREIILDGCLMNYYARNAK